MFKLKVKLKSEKIEDLKLNSKPGLCLQHATSIYYN